MWTGSLTRRSLLKRLGIATLAAGTLPISTTFSRTPPRIGIALGAGGARGLAHIPILEALDELKIKPHRISGTSIGAVIGALYASGRSPAEIKNIVAKATVKKNAFFSGRFFMKGVLEWTRLADPTVESGRTLLTQDFLEILDAELQSTTFEELSIPLRVVSADISIREQVVFSTGELKPALRASFAIPGIFSVYEYQGRILVDGGTVNPVPYDILFDECDIVIAVDVAGPNHSVEGAPSFFERVLNTLRTMEHAIVTEKLRVRAPTILIRPELTDIRIMDFARAEEIYSQSKPAVEKFKADLERLLKR